ncbi:D-glycerate dehydrogenase [Paenibacillus sp. NEAU-GSW1]|uniref:2-hydroxyacid dehydrogenase n=1 Tax=Paenibacillus sp. NEAU-GSW1 TaxID=2682486 RepID=UPI0012E1C5A5|nr:D-glycerate dehydrogenase [Paenibacillus sp. NEAU-GSW1]MUT65832.1 bifunctional glyoxylate/hydroxypyruvate reductase B [Paenibacillus sp. NEAU-GSW1]
MKPKAYIASKVSSEVKEYLDQHCECEYWQGAEAITGAQLAERLADAEGLLVSGNAISERLLGSAPKLRVVSNVSVGYNNNDLNAMRSRGIIGTHTPYVLDDTVADLTLALMLAAARRVTELHNLVRSGGWQRGIGPSLFGVDVHHAKLGIIGMGRIGEMVAKRAKFGFDMDVSYYNRNRKPEAEQKLGLSYLPLNELLAQSDFVVLLAPLTPETKRMIGAEQFTLMKPTAAFINVSRGENVDEAALVEALRSGTIRAAALDVYEKEPVSVDNPLLQLDNVVTLPHIGSATAATRNRMAMLAAENLVEALYGREPKYVIPELKA